jgi:hypothetical protein
MHRSNPQDDAVVSVVSVSRAQAAVAIRTTLLRAGAEPSKVRLRVRWHLGRRNWFRTPCYQKSTQAIVEERAPGFV